MRATRTVGTSSTSQTVQRLPAAVDLFLAEKKEDVDEIKNLEAERDNKIIDAETEERTAQRGEKRETESIVIVAGNLVSHDKTAAGKTDEEIREEIHFSAIFRIHEQQRNSPARSDIPAHKTEHQEPENDQHRIFLYLDQQQLNGKKVNKPPDERVTIDPGS